MKRITRTYHITPVLYISLSSKILPISTYRHVESKVPSPFGNQHLTQSLQSRARGLVQIGVIKLVKRVTDLTVVVVVVAPPARPPDASRWGQPNQTPPRSGVHALSPCLLRSLSVCVDANRPPVAFSSNGGCSPAPMTWSNSTFMHGEHRCQNSDGCGW